MEHVLGIEDDESQEEKKQVEHETIKDAVQGSEKDKKERSQQQESKYREHASVNRGVESGKAVSLGSHVGTGKRRKRRLRLRSAEENSRQKVVERVGDR